MEVFEWVAVDGWKAMQLYACKVLNKDGEIVGKKVFAEEEANLFELFQKSGLLFISKSSQKSSIRHPISDFTLPFFTNLSQLVKNKTNLIEALKIIKNLFKNEEAQSAVDTIIHQIRLGATLSQSLSKFMQYFDKTSLKAIEVSEKTAELPGTLEKIVYHLNEELKLKNKIKESMRYPLILLAFIGITFIFWTVVLVPKFAELFSELNIQVPTITRFVINFSNFVANNILFVFMGLMGCLFLQRHKKISWDIYKIPIFNQIKREIQMYNFFTAMEVMLHNKVNIIEALECVSDIVPSILEVIDTIKSGFMLSSAISKAKILNEYELSMVRVGEKSGELWGAFKTASDVSRQNIEALSKRIVSTIQPIAIIFVGLLLIILVYALISPLYSNLNIAF